MKETLVASTLLLNLLVAGCGTAAFNTQIENANMPVNATGTVNIGNKAVKDITKAFPVGFPFNKKPSETATTKSADTEPVAPPVSNQASEQSTPKTVVTETAAVPSSTNQSSGTGSVEPPSLGQPAQAPATETATTPSSTNQSSGTGSVAPPALNPPAQPDITTTPSVTTTVPATPPVVAKPTFTYSSGGSSTTVGGGTWGGILSMSLNIVGSKGYFTVLKQSGAFKKDSTVYLKVGTFESFGVNSVPSKTISANASGIDTPFEFDFATVDANWPKNYYIRVENSDGNAWVGPITVYRN